jgi:MFS family permease
MSRAFIGQVAIGCLASVVALALQNLLRDAWQIRTLPERVMEWLLLFVPLDLFERGLAQFGADAKEVGLTATLLGMAVILAAIGVLALRAGWRAWWLIGLGLGLWLITMAVVMPITGAGLFATDLLIDPLLTNAGYLLVFLGYASALVAGQSLLTRRDADRPIMAERRALLAGVVGTLAAGGIATIVGREGGLVSSSLPLAEAAPTATPAPTAAAEPAAAATPAVAPSPTPEPLPNPPPPRRLARDKDGALTAAGRPKGQLAPAISANADFYIVTKNAVQDPIEITKTLECISNFTAACTLTSFGCDLISTARWKGARLADVLDLAGGLKPGAVGLALLSTDEFSAGLPADVVQDPETLVAYEMNGEPLPREHGFPARLLVPGRYGMKNPKWLAGIRAMNQEYAGWYEQRNWDKDGIVKTMSRIDVPADGASLPPGEQRVAGIAYAGDRGISKVEFSTDDGASWQPTQIIEPMPGKDAMVRWQAVFIMPPSGSLSITTRATDGTGEIQTDEFQLPQPDGASGRDVISVAAA